MHSHTDVALTLIEDFRIFLQGCPDPVFATEEECAHFREKLKKKKVEPPPPIPVVMPPPIIEVKPKEIPLPVIKPVVEEKPPAVEMPVFVSDKWLREILTRVTPGLAILEEVPSDAMAKKINSRWKTKNQTAPITVLCDQELPEQKALLEQISKALDVQFGPAALVAAESIEKENQWEAFLSVETLKLVICCDYTLWQLPKLRAFFKEVPAQKTRLLGGKPIFLLPDLSLYLKDPLLKRSLWKALCQMLRSSPSSSTKT